jgi:hypothetical protein
MSNSDINEHNLKIPIKEYLSEDYLRLIEPSSWPIPKWIANDKEHREGISVFFSPDDSHLHYEDYFATQLRARYMELETDFRTIYSEYIVGKLDDEDKEELPYILSTSEYVVNLLKSAKGILEIGRLEKKSLLSATNLLDLAEKYSIWIIPPELAGTKIPALESRLIDVKPNNLENHQSNLDTLKRELIDLRNNKEKLQRYRKNKAYAELIIAQQEKEIENKKKDPSMVENPDMDKNLDVGRVTLEAIITDIKDLSRSMDKIKYAYRSTFAAIIWACNQKLLADIIEIGLQIERLSALRLWGSIFFFIFFIISPIFFNFTIFENLGLDPSKLTNYPSLFPWIVSLGIAIIGGAGGFLSGLLQVRSSRTTLASYEESIILLQLRPIFGAFAALILTMLLSWGALEGVLSKNVGSFVLVAFLSGFSERYFLNLLRMEPKKDQTEFECPKPKNNQVNFIPVKNISESIGAGHPYATENSGNTVPGEEKFH